MGTIWKNACGRAYFTTEAKSSDPAADPKLEVGKVLLLRPLAWAFDVSWKDDKSGAHRSRASRLFQLEEHRRSALQARANPRTAGFFATFRPVKDKESETELFLEQPQGNVVAPESSRTMARNPLPIPAVEAQGRAWLPVSMSLLTNMIAAYGGRGEPAQTQICTVTTGRDRSWRTRGVQAKGSISARAPNLTASDMTFTALGKKTRINRELSSTAPAAAKLIELRSSEETYSGKRLEDVQSLGADFLRRAELDERTTRRSP